MKSLKVLSFFAGVAMIAVVGFTSTSVSHAPDLAKVSDEMTQAAQAFWKGLTPEQQGKAKFEFKDAERVNWHFIPRARKGLPLKEMTPDQRKLAQALLATGLSQKGNEKALKIMSLEQILRELEGPNGRMVRDPELYYFSVFGVPDAKGTWGWRVEGHHLSINVTIAAGKAINITPSFFGSNPGEVKDGPMKGLRVLGNDEEMGRSIVKSLNADQKAAAVYSDKAPGDLLLVPGKKVELLDPAGVSHSKLDEKQKAAVWTLIQEYANRHRGELASQDLSKIEAAGRDKISFAWAGGLERGQPHYYRIQGPTFVLEYDNVQGGANHVHSVWHDPADNFGEDILKKHYQESHGK